MFLARYILTSLLPHYWPFLSSLFQIRPGSIHRHISANVVCECLWSILETSQLLSCWASLGVREDSASRASLMKVSSCKTAGSRAWSCTPASWRCLHTRDNWLIINQVHSHVNCSQSKLVAWRWDVIIPLETFAGRDTGITSKADPPNDAASINTFRGWDTMICPHSWNHQRGTGDMPVWADYKCCLMIWLSNRKSRAQTCNLRQSATVP